MCRVPSGLAFLRAAFFLLRGDALDNALPLDKEDCEEAIDLAGVFLADDALFCAKLAFFRALDADATPA